MKETCLRHLDPEERSGLLIYPFIFHGYEQGLEETSPLLRYTVRRLLMLNYHAQDRFF